MEEGPGLSSPEALLGETQGKRLKMAWRGEGTFNSSQGTRSTLGWGPQAPGGFQRCKAQGLCISLVRTLCEGGLGGGGAAMGIW